MKSRDDTTDIGYPAAVVGLVVEAVQGRDVLLRWRVAAPVEAVKKIDDHCLIVDHLWARRSE